MAKEGKGKGKKIVLLVLFLLLVALVGGAFGLGILKIPKCATPLQEKVDWPPEENGIYEKSGSERLRELEGAPRLPITPPTRVQLCNLPEEGTDVVAFLPAEPEVVVVADSFEGYEFHVYHSVEIPDTGDCVFANTENEVEGITVSEEDGMMAVTLPSPLESGQTYLFSVGEAPPGTCNTGADQDCRGVVIRLNTDAE